MHQYESWATGINSCNFCCSNGICSYREVGTTIALYLYAVRYQTGSISIAIIRKTEKSTCHLQSNYLDTATSYTQSTKLWNHFEREFCLFPVLKKQIYLAVKTKNAIRRVSRSKFLCNRINKLDSFLITSLLINNVWKVNRTE